MIFTGRARRGRPINLSGKQQLSRDDVLRRAEAQRKERETVRREQHACRVIQIRWRSLQAVRSARREILTVFLQDPTAVPPEYFVPVLPWAPESLAIQSLKLIHGGSSRLCSRLVNLCLACDGHLRTVCLEVIAQCDTHPSVALLVGLPDSEPLHVALRKCATVYPREFIQGLLHSSKEVPFSVLEPLKDAPLFNIDGLDVIPLAARLAPYPQFSRVVASLIASLSFIREVSANERQALSPCVSKESIYQVCGHELDMQIIASYFLNLFQILPEHKPEILLHLSFAVRSPPMAVRAWHSYISHGGESLSLAVELWSWWLPVTPDSEIFKSERLGFTPQMFENVAEELRDMCFEYLWSGTTTHTRAPFNSTFLNFLRQIYIRDARRKLFSDGFWLMEHHMATNWDKVAEEQWWIPSYDEEYEHSTSAPVRILQKAPFFVQFSNRVGLLYRLIDRDRQQTSLSSLWGPRVHHDINRETLVDDAETVFAELGPRIKDDLAVRLVSNGVPEAGIDGGGLTKEVLTAIAAEAFTPQSPYWCETPSHTLIPNPIWSERPWPNGIEAARAKYRFLGQVVGKCLYENLLIDVEFSYVFLMKWAGASATRASFDDLYLLDLDLYNSLVSLLHLSPSDIEALDLDFTIQGPGSTVVELKPHGAQVQLTDSNKLEYARCVANYKLNNEMGPQTNWFLQGFGEIINLAWLQMFNGSEIQMLISGGHQDIDIEDLRAHAEFSGWAFDSPTLENLWHVLHEFNSDQRKAFLKFVTSVPRGPLLGFKHLTPRFGIRCAGRSDERLPTSSTCVNLLKIPEYSSKEILRNKLLYSIESGAGFDLS